MLTKIRSGPSGSGPLPNPSRSYVAFWSHFFVVSYVSTIVASISNCLKRGRLGRLNRLSLRSRNAYPLHLFFRCLTFRKLFSLNVMQVVPRLELYYLQSSDPLLTMVRS